MIWLDLKELERKLSSNDFSEKASIGYYIGLFMLSIIYAIVATFLGKSPIDSIEKVIAISHYLLDALIFAIGVLVAYKLNARIDNKDFFMRYFSLSFVILIRLIIYTICIGIFILFIGFFTNLPEFDKTMMSYFSHLWKILYYILIALSFKRISGLNQQVSNEATNKKIPTWLIIFSSLSFIPMVGVLFGAISIIIGLSNIKRFKLLFILAAYGIGLNMLIYFSYHLHNKI